MLNAIKLLIISLFSMLVSDKLKPYIDNKATATLQSAATDAQNKATAAENAAKAHADAGDVTTLASAATDAQNKATAAENAAKAHADAGDVTTLASAATDAQNKATAAENAAKAYADLQDAANLLAAKAYADAKIASAADDIDVFSAVEFDAFSQTVNVTNNIELSEIINAASLPASMAENEKAIIHIIAADFAAVLGSANIYYEQTRLILNENAVSVGKMPFNGYIVVRKTASNFEYVNSVGSTYFNDLKALRTLSQVQTQQVITDLEQLQGQVDSLNENFTNGQNQQNERLDNIEADLTLFVRSSELETMFSEVKTSVLAEITTILAA